MKKLFTLAILLLAGLKLFAADTQLDSLKMKLQQNTNDTLKGQIYSQIAAQYLKYDTIANKRKKFYYQSEALNYTMLALHNYSKYEDTTGLRVSFDNLAKVYHSQKKYSQAKWFILQSSNISRIKNDVPNLVASLIKLSTIKMDLKDYKLAMRDLNEALSLSTTNKIPKLESAVQLNYSFLYNRMKDYEKGTIALKRSQTIDEDIKKEEAAQILAMQAGQDSIQARKTDSIVSSKKKAYVSTIKKKIVRKTLPSPKRLASL